MWCIGSWIIWLEWFKFMLRFILSFLQQMHRLVSVLYSFHVTNILIVYFVDLQFSSLPHWRTWGEEWQKLLFLFCSSYNIQFSSYFTQMSQINCNILLLVVYLVSAWPHLQKFNIATAYAYTIARSSSMQWLTWKHGPCHAATGLLLQHTDTCLLSWCWGQCGALTRLK